MSMDISNQSSTGNMIVGHCFACNGMVRIPVDANPQATVRCPRCSVEFKLGDVLEQAAPALEVLDQPFPPIPKKSAPRIVPIVDDGPIQPVDRKPGDKFVVSPILQKNSKRKKRRRRSRSKSSSTENSAATAASIPAVTLTEPAGTAPEPARSAAVATRPRSSRKTKKSSSSSSSSESGGIELAKIIFGAALAIPVAQLLIWWFAGTDPLNLGPKISKVAPFVVPIEFREEDPDGQGLFGDGVDENGKKTLGTLPIPKSDPDSLKLDDLDDLD